MDSLHYFLLFIIILLITINNISIIKKYYYPWFFSTCKKLMKRIKGYMKEEFVLEKNINEDRKKSDFYQNIDITKLKQIQKKLSWNYNVAVMNLNSNLNIGAIYRSGCLLGMKNYLILGKKIYNPKSQVGLGFVPINYLDTFKKIRDRKDSSTLEDFNVDLFQQYIEENKLIPILIEQGGINLIDVDFYNFERSKEQFLFIFGNETHGIPKNLIQLAKNKTWLIISIPQWGCAHSYNVSQAANIVMWKYYNDNIVKMLNH